MRGCMAEPRLALIRKSLFEDILHRASGLRVPIVYSLLFGTVLAVFVVRMACASNAYGQHQGFQDPAITSAWQHMQSAGSRQFLQPTSARQLLQPAVVLQNTRLQRPWVSNSPFAAAAFDSAAAEMSAPAVVDDADPANINEKLSPAMATKRRDAVLALVLLSTFSLGENALALAIDDYDKAIVDEIKRVKANACKAWEGISASMHSSLERGTPKDLRDAESVLLIKLGSIKSDMRRVSEFATGGDTIVRKDNGKPMYKNYNRVVLKPLPQRAEDIFSSLDKIAPATKKGDASMALKVLDEADAAYADWLQLLKEVGI
eukprot:gnl/TRDRNA2_/TRDRNA2_71476_c0_seq1.p1 gnl/TRDRNA2_/TRDRNA2_71476_c0~~gnl/TRDRNA2_/TRDRNA2_71476_c0_seq1.p1  ORF type:complete len:318 (+),score=49.49 gnl/TRDRNA2_/TRDRNA2_71476_c0_seq1:38-991(+)